MMRLERPQSVIGLVLLGFCFVALPLLVAILLAALSVDKLAQRSHRLTLHGVDVTRIHALLSDNLVDMERYARQYYVVGDSSLWGLYLENKAAFLANLGGLERIDDKQRFGQVLEELYAHSEALQEVPKATTDVELTSEHAAPAEMLESFASLREITAATATLTQRFIDNELHALANEASAARRRLAWQSAALLPITIGLVAVFTSLIARPIRNLGAAITQLGERGFSDTIAIVGPPELRALGARLDWLRVRLSEADETKNNFLRHMSHELKTPLASLREGTDLLADGDVGQLEDTQREVVEILQDNCAKLRLLIENLLDFHAWESDAQRLQISQFSALAFVEETLEQLQLLIRRKELSVELNVTVDQLAADRERLNVALENLITNAVKYSPAASTIEIRVSRCADEVFIDVVDQGPGVSAADREFVFEPFFQGSQNASSFIRGTGLGLSLARECAIAHAGRIEIVDSHSRGGYFRLVLPQTKIEANRE